MAQADQFTGEVQQGIGVFLLCLHRQLSVFRIHREIESGRLAGGEAGGRTGSPLHRSTCPGTFVATLFGRKIHLVFHADFVTIIDKRYTRHGQEEGHGHLQLVHRVTRADVRTLEIVVGRRNGDVAELLCAVEGCREVVDKLLHLSFSCLVEVAELVLLGDVLSLPRPAVRCVAVEEERGIALDAEVDHEVDVEAGRDGDGRVAPLGYQYALGIMPVLPCPHLVPQL